MFVKKRGPHNQNWAREMQLSLSFCVKFHTKKKKRDFSQIFGFVAVINLFRWCFVVLFSPKRREKQKQKKKTKKKKRDRRGTEEETRLC